MEALSDLRQGFLFLFHIVRFSDGRLAGIPWFAATVVMLDH